MLVNNYVKLNQVHFKGINNQIQKTNTPLSFKSNERDTFQKQDSGQPERTKRIKQRFDSTIKNLGNMDDLKEVIWPELTRVYTVKGNKITYKPINNIEESAERIAEMFRNGYDECNSEEYRWLLQPDEIIQNAKSGDWKLFGIHHEGKLIGAGVICIHQAQRAIEWSAAVIDPVDRGKNAFQPIGKYIDESSAKSGAQQAYAYASTTHDITQKTLEAAGFTPLGLSVGSIIEGGSDRKYYRGNYINYSKLYGDGIKHLQPLESMKLTEKAKKIVDVILSNS